MIVRDFMAGDKAVPVEQLNIGLKQGCVVRWDFENVKNQVITADARECSTEEHTELQFAEQDSDFVACSVKVYHELPAADVVIADIEADLVARYKDSNRPDIDLEQYRLAIEKLHNINRVE